MVIIASYVVMMAVSAALCGLFIYEVAQRVRHGKPWVTPFTAGFAPVVALTVLLQWLAWYRMVNPQSRNISALFAAVFALWSGSIVWWIYDMLRHALTEAVRRGELDAALQRSVASMTAPHLETAEEGADV